jgi:hypothetical protein
MGGADAVNSFSQFQESRHDVRHLYIVPDQVVRGRNADA